MIRDIVRFEWRFHTRQISFAAAALLFFVFGFALTASGFGPSNVHIDSPYSITQSIGLLSLFSLFILAVFCANAVVRDRETGMEEIVFTTSVEKLPFLLGRFTGSFLAAFTAFSTSALGMFAARFMPWHDADRVGDVSVLPYLWALLVVALPNMLFAAVALFGLATVTRSVLASYAGSVLLYVLYFVAAAMTNSPLMAASNPAAGGSSLAALLDPFALSAFFEQTSHWTSGERNARLVALTGSFLVNRVVWVGAAVGGLAVVYRLFSFRVMGVRRKRREKKAAAEPPHSKARSAFGSAVRMETRAFLLNKAFLAMLLLWVGLIAFELISDLTGGEYGSALYPTSGLLLATIRQPLSIVGIILLIYMSAEMVWRERAVRFAGILHATPASNALFVAAKCVALAALVVTLTVSALVTAAVVQLANGWPVEPLVLLSFAWFLAAPLVVFAVLAVVIQTLSPHKYVGMLLVLLLAMTRLFGELVGLRHPLARITPPDIVHSDMSGFGRTAGFHWSLLYWSAIAGALLVFAITRWRGRRERVARVPVMAMIAIAVASGAFIAANTDTTDLLAWRAEYEKNYKRFASAPQPRVESMTAHFDLHPEDYRYRVRGECVLRNDSGAPVGELLVTVRRGAKPRLLTIDPPLAPRARMTVRFDMIHAAGRLENADYSYITSVRALPFIGYVSAFEIDDARERRRRGLPPATVRAEREIPVADWVDLDLTVSTSPGHTVVAPGRLQRTWDEGGRRHARFRTDAPIPIQFGIGSARYAVTRATHDGRVAVELYHHPSHTVNVPKLLKAATDSLALYEKSFGRYDKEHLRVAEVSLRNFSGFAQPGVVFLGENRGFLLDARDPRRLDLGYRRLAHEIAHQWWGYTLIPADVPGATALTESLTKYSELLALQKAYGIEKVRQSLEYELDYYLAQRTSEEGAEPPLAKAGEQAYLYYRKGALVMHALQDLLGEQAMNAALRNLLREQGGPSRKPTTAHLIQHLKAVAPPQHHPLIDEWMNDVVLYDLRLDSADARPLGGDRYEVTLRITASKQRATGETLPMNETIATSLGRHLIRSGAQEIVVVTNEKPEAVTIDPNLTRVDRNRFDNTRPVNMQAQP